MQKGKNFYRWPRLTGAACGGLALMAGVTALLGYVSPLPANTAASLALAGLAVVGVAMRLRWLVLGCSGVVGAIACLSVVDPARMPPAAIVGFVALATGLALAHTLLRHKRSPVLGIAGLAVMAIGSTLGISALARTSDVFVSGNATRMAVYTGVGLVLLGIGLTALAWELSQHKVKEPLWVPIGLSLVVATFRVELWQALSARTTVDFLSILTLFGGLVAAGLFGVVLHLALKARLQREVLRNVNRRLQKEIAERRLAEEAAQSANRSKSEFLATMSHEIRTPMAGVLGMLDLTLATELSTEQAEYLAMARSSADSLLSLLNDILDLSKIEAHRLDLLATPFSIRQCLRESLRIFAVRAKEKGLELISLVEPDVPDAVVGDPLRLRQVLVNLVGNAIKFTDRGQVTIRVRQQPDAGSGITLRVQVSDTGIGIPAEKRALIFDPFRQADGSAARRYGGTGLGLTISARLVQLMGGTIAVESEAGKGSTFSFTARLTCNTGQAAQTTTDLSSLATVLGPIGAERRALRILLAEDNVVNQKLATVLLTKEGHDIVVVSDGKQAVAALAEQSYDLVLMDIQMPDMDGLEATAKIRHSEKGTGRHTPIVAMTAHAMNGDKQQCLAAGMDDYLTKPISIADLRATLAKFQAVSVNQTA